MRRLLSIIAVLAILAAPSYAASTWFVSPAGSNANNCMGPGPSQACQSINYVILNKFACGDTIDVRGGQYYLPATDSGLITWPVCAQGSSESTIVSHNYGWGAQLTPTFNQSGGITSVSVTNGSSACSNGYCGSYNASTTLVGVSCPGLAGAGILAPASATCGSGFSATATLNAGVITSISVSSAGSGYPSNAVVWATSGETPIYSDMLQVYDSTNCSGSNCGFNGSSYAATNCASGNTGITNGCLILTFSADNNDTNFPSCTTGSNCDLWVATLPSSFPFVDTIFYQQTTGCPTTCATSPIFRRQIGIQPLKNAQGKTCDSAMCVTAANQAAADTACGCSGAPNGHCSAQVSPASGPTQWWCGYIKWEYHNSDLNNLHSLLIGDMRVQCQEIWTMCYLRLASATAGTPNVATATGPASAINGINAGFIAGHQYYLKNRPADVNNGDWYLDRCPSQWSSSSSCNSGTPESTWKLYIAADISGCPMTPCENAQHDVIWIPQHSLPLASGNGVNSLQLLGIQFDGGQYTVPSTGLPSTQGQPAVPETVQFGCPLAATGGCASGSTTVNSAITLEGVTLQHVGGEGLGFHGSVQGITIDSSAFTDCWGACVRVGDIATGSDVCSGVGQNVPSGLVFTNNLINGSQREDPTGEALTLYIGDVNGITVSHNDIFRWYSGGMNAGHGLNLGAEGGQLSFCMANYVIDHNHFVGQYSGGEVLGIVADFGVIYLASNHSPLSPAASLFSDPAQVQANYNVLIHDNIIEHAACDPALSNTYHCTAGIYGDQGTWGVDAFNNLIMFIGGEDIFPHLSSHGQGTFGASEYVGQHFWVHNNYIYGNGSSQMNAGSVYRRGTIALGTGVFDQNLELIDTTPNATNPLSFFRQNDFNGFWAAYDQSDATITNHGSPTCGGAVDCASPATATVNGCTGATVTVAVDSIAGAFSGVIGVNINNPGTSCVSPTLSWTNCPSCAATLCTSGGSLVSCTPVPVNPVWAFQFGGHGNVVYDARGNFPQSGLCTIVGCNTGNTLYAYFPWPNTGTFHTEDVGSVACDWRPANVTNYDFHPTNIPCLLKTSTVTFNYTLAGRTVPIIGANSPPNLFPALTPQLVLDSSYNSSYGSPAPFTNWNPAGGSGLTIWK